MSSEIPGLERTELALKLFTTVIRAAETFQQNVFQQNPLEGKLSETEFAILEALLNRGPMHQCDVARRILRSRGNISVTVQQLVVKGLVYREEDPSDRRHTNIRLSEEGEELIREVFTRVASLITKESEHMSCTEMQSFIELNKKLGLGGLKHES